MILPAAGHAGATLRRGGAARADVARRPAVRLAVRAVIGLTIRAVVVRPVVCSAVRAAIRIIVGLAVPAAVTVVIVVRPVHTAIGCGRYIAVHPVRADAARRAAPGQHKRQQADCQQADPDSSHVRFLPK